FATNIRYVKGKQNIVADTLSSIPSSTTKAILQDRCQMVHQPMGVAGAQVPDIDYIN
ncbi:Hypothetical protein FKW44_006510, partial [Caligus rogercresseyi]